MTVATAASDDRAAVQKRLRSLARRYNRATATLAKLERERADLYQEARACTPPITFKWIADTFGVTEAAVMQKLRREARPPKKPKAPV